MAKTIELPHSIPQNEFEKPAKVFRGIFFTKYLTQNQQILDSSMFFQSCNAATHKNAKNVHLQKYSQNMIPKMMICWQGRKMFAYLRLLKELGFCQGELRGWECWQNPDLDKKKYLIDPCLRWFLYLVDHFVQDNRIKSGFAWFLSLFSRAVLWLKHPPKVGPVLVIVMVIVIIAVVISIPECDLCGSCWR